MLHFSAAILLFSLTSSIANAAPWRALGDHTTPTVGRAATAVQVINDGTSFQTGTSTPGTPGLGWQASGYLAYGGCTPGVQCINTCYEITESNDPNAQLIPNADTPRQRVEFLSNQGADETSWHFTWKSYLDSADTGSSSFFHTMQIFSAGDDAPAYYTNLMANTFRFVDYWTGEILVSVPANQILGRPLQHTLDVTYGLSGSVSYVIGDSTGANILSYQSGAVTRRVGSGGSYLKFGSYRETYDGMPNIKMWVGDYTGAQK